MLDCLNETQFENKMTSQTFKNSFFFFHDPHSKKLWENVVTIPFPWQIVVKSRIANVLNNISLVTFRFDVVLKVWKCLVYIKGTIGTTRIDQRIMLGIF
jgi:hypothetical protein